MTTTSHTTLVTGGTGKTGRRVADRLQARGLTVRVGSRSGAPPFHWEDQSTWCRASREMTMLASLSVRTLQAAKSPAVGRA